MGSLQPWSISKRAVLRAPIPAHTSADSPNSTSGESVHEARDRLPNAKLSRTSTAKVRTGCITCKRRHVKCDEEKPYCRRCLTFSGHCEGYAPRTSSKRHGLTAPAVQVAPLMAQTLLDPDLLDFHDATALRYFGEFVTLAQGPWITASSYGDLWTVTLPQLARVNGTLRHAAMAIGALSAWHRESGSHTLQTPLESEPLASALDSTPYFDATTNLCHALRLQSRGASVQDAVFLSLMLLCFETLRGNRKAALSHVNHGLALLLALVTDQESNRQINSLAPNPRPLLAMVADIFTNLATQARAMYPGRVGGCAPMANFAKGLRDRGLTLESFMVLLSQLPRPAADLDSTPSVFATLDDFEHHWTTLQRNQATVGPVVLDIVHSSGVLGSSDEAVISDFYNHLMGHPRIRAFYDVARQRMRALDAAFMPLFRQTMLQPPDSPNYLRALHLRLRYLGVYAVENPPQYLDVASLNAQTPLFREYISLASAALRAARATTTNPAHRASLQCCLSWYLLPISFFCRDALVRDEAIALLEGYSGQDGLCSARSLCVLALRNRDVERANAVEGTETEQWMRMWRREYVFEEGGEAVVFRYMERDDSTGVWGLVEEGAVVPVEGEAKWVRRPIGDGKLLMVDLML